MRANIRGSAGRQSALDLIETVFRLGNRAAAVFIRPHRGDQIQFVCEPVKNQYHRRSHEQHVGQVQSGLRCTRQFFNQSDRLVSEIADQAGKRARQLCGDVHLAGFDKIAKRGQAVFGHRFKCFAIIEPVVIDFRFVRGSPEHQIGRETDQAVAPPGLAAFHGFEQKIAATFLHQLERSGYRGFGVRNLPPPDQRRLAVIESCARRFAAETARHRSSIPAE